MCRQAFRFCVVVVLVGIISALPGPAIGQKKKGKAGKETVVPTGPPKLWRDPGMVERLDFTGGPGGADKTPQPPFTFIEEDTGGSNPKVKVRDAAGRSWGVKWGSEVNAEVFASRLAWAAGYYVEPTYFVKSGVIQGVTGLQRAKKVVQSDGRFSDARFELKDENVRTLTGSKSWRWDTNPFVGTKELNGLKVIIMLTSNWDSKDQRDAGRGSNTAIFIDRTTGETRYQVTDWGGSMGKWGSYFSREKWDCKGFTDQTGKFVIGVNAGQVEFGYTGQRTDDVRRGITVSDLRWILGYIGRISDAQLQAGLRASGATEQEVTCFTAAVRNRINQLKNVAGSRNASG